MRLRFWSICCLAPVTLGRSVFGFRAQQLVFLRLYGVARATCNWGIGRACLCNQQIASRRAANEHAQCRIAVLAFHGSAVDLFAIAATYENLRPGHVLYTKAAVYTD